MINTEESLVIIIDAQEKLLNAVIKGADTADKISKLSRAAKILSIPVLATEQYPKGLGATIDGIYTDAKIEKTAFSALHEQEFQNIIKTYNKKQIILCGAELHICVLQTALDFINQGCEVYIPCDCVSSRNERDLITGLEYIKSAGASVVTLEMVLFGWLKNSKHPNFKEIQALIK